MRSRLNEFFHSIGEDSAMGKRVREFFQGEPAIKKLQKEFFHIARMTLTMRKRLKEFFHTIGGGSAMRSRMAEFLFLLVIACALFHLGGWPKIIT